MKELLEPLERQRIVEDDACEPCAVGAVLTDDLRSKPLD